MTRQCNMCKEYKSLDEYHNCKSFPLGKTYTCKVCAKAKSIAWNKANPELKKQYGKKHYEDNKEKYNAPNPNKVLWAKANRERINTANRKRWAKNNGECRAKLAAVRASKLQRTPSWLTNEHKEDITTMYVLAKKLEKLCGVLYHVDHIVPLQGKNVSGLHVPWNLQVLAASLNISKGNRY